MPKQKTVIIPLSNDEANKLINTSLEYKNRNGVDCSNLDESYISITEFFLFTGCRFDEGASLKVKNLDIDSGRAYLIDTKNKENRFIFFNGPIKIKLRKLTQNKKPEDLVFTNSRGNKLLNGDFDNNIKRRAKKAGITKKVNAHLLRHTYGTLYYNQTHDIAMTATLLGHKDIQVTYDTYVHLDTEGIQQASNRYPLVSQYISTQELLTNLKMLIENQKLDKDKRFQINLETTNNELKLTITAIEA